MAAERHQGKPARKRKRDEDDAAEGDIASSDEEAEIGEGLPSIVGCSNKLLQLDSLKLIEHSDLLPSWGVSMLVMTAAHGVDETGRFLRQQHG